MVRFIHTADWQLGMGHSYLAPEALHRLQQARIEAIDRIAAVATESGASFVVVAGDVFDTNRPDRGTVQRACAAMRNIPVPVYLLPGNHDPLDGASVFHSSVFLDAKPDNVIVLDDELPRAVTGVDAEVVGAPYRTKHPIEDLSAIVVESLDTAPSGVARVLVAHGAADEVMEFSDSRSAPTRVAPLTAAVADGRIHYVALGDRHSTLDVGDHGTIWYSGAPEPTRFKEDRPGNVLVVDLQPGAAPDVNVVAIGTWRFERLEFELSDMESIRLLDEHLAGLTTPANTIVRCTLRGIVSMAARVELDEVVERHAATLGLLDLPGRHDHLITEPKASDMDDLGLTGYVADALETLRDSTDPASSDALAELYRAAKEVAR